MQNIPCIIYDTPTVQKDVRDALNGGVMFLAVGGAARVLAQQLGGVVESMPSRTEQGIVEIYLLSLASEDPLFATLPATFYAPCSRTDDITMLPLQCVPLANSERTQFQAFKIAGKFVYGLQFEPPENLLQRFQALFHTV